MAHFTSEDEINKTLQELHDLITPNALGRMQSAFFSLYNRIEELRNSRDNWRKKYEESKDEVRRLAKTSA